MGLSDREIATSLSLLANQIIDRGIVPTVYTRYQVYSVFATKEERKEFLELYIWFFITDFLGNTPRQVVASVTEHKLVRGVKMNPSSPFDDSENQMEEAWAMLEYPENIEEDFVYISIRERDYTLGELEQLCFNIEEGTTWKFWRRLLNTLDIATPGPVTLNSSSADFWRYISKRTEIREQDFMSWFHRSSLRPGRSSGSKRENNQYHESNERSEYDKILGEEIDSIELNTSDVSDSSDELVVRGARPDELFKMYLGGNRSFENLAFSLVEAAETSEQMRIAETIFKRWIEKYFARQGLELHLESKTFLNKAKINYDVEPALIDQNAIPLSYIGYSLPLFSRVPEVKRFSTPLNPGAILSLLPSTPPKYTYTSEFISYITPRIWAHRYLCWVEWSQLRISTLKHRDRLVELMDIQVLEFISGRDLIDLVLDSPPEHFSLTQCYAWKVLLHNISMALIDRVIRFSLTRNETLAEKPILKFPWLNRRQMKIWYRQDPTYFMLVLLKACPPTQARIRPGIILESMGRKD
jgi:hypothetical protein